MESATVDRFMTKDTVAGESARCSARVLKLMGFRPRRPAALPLLLAFLVATLLISHNRNRRAS
jgi:hypothetical protein